MVQIMAWCRSGDKMSKRRRDVVLVSLSRYYCVMCPLGKFSSLRALCDGLTNGFPLYIMGTFNVFASSNLNKLLTKLSSCGWFERLWRRRDVIVIAYSMILSDHTCKAPLRLARFSVPRNRQAVRAECHILPRAVFCCNWRDYRQRYRARFA